MKYVTPEIELLAFAATDVIMTSDGEETDRDNFAGDFSEIGTI